MAPAFPILLAAEMLPPELPELGGKRPGGEIEGELVSHLPFIAAALLVMPALDAYGAIDHFTLRTDGNVTAPLIGYLRGRERRRG